MSEQPQIDYNQLTAGFEFPPRVYVMDAALVSLYLEATQESGSLFKLQRLVPPMAVMALAIAALSQSISLPSGTIHVTQELDFLTTVKINDSITCYAKVSRKLERGGMRLLNTDFTVNNQDNQTVLTGKAGFILPSITDRASPHGGTDPVRQV